MDRIRRYWPAAVILVAGGAFTLWLGLVTETTTGALWAGGVTGVLTGMAIAAVQGRRGDQ